MSSLPCSQFGVLATVLLLGLWLYQQTEVERRSRDLQKLTSARAVYQTYQSNNAIFNAVNEVAAESKSERIRQFQIYNYELGLRAIEDALPNSACSRRPMRSEARRAVKAGCGTSGHKSHS
jgi:hypothetical protein